jgi:hypothetical protein
VIQDMVGHGMGQVAFSQAGVGLDIKTRSESRIIHGHCLAGAVGNHVAFSDYEFSKGVAGMQGPDA